MHLERKVQIVAGENIGGFGDRPSIRQSFTIQTSSMLQYVIEHLLNSPKLSHPDTHVERFHQYFNQPTF